MVAYHSGVETVLLTINLTLTLIVMLAACLCCKKKVQKNELLGLEGMVKLKNPDEVVVVTTVVNSESQAELNTSTVSNADSEKRSSTAAHRSLPDIPIAEQNGDNCSELYETVADKLLVDSQHPRNKSPTPSLKKQTSISQHSSISQADDVSSPYSRVKNLPHDYAKVQRAEHPYAQLNAPSTSTTAATLTACINSTGVNHSNHTLHGGENNQRNSQLNNNSMQNPSDDAPQAEIPAASAIAGMISASQDLPYMTPPIGNQHFSGDSQDSSKGYTSISVREPLANILAQHPTKAVTCNPSLSRDVNDSHYATVSDDSDETYAAIEDPNSRNITNVADIYTSGSETYAQIQPMQVNPIVVSVEINSNSSSVVDNMLDTSANTAKPLNQSGISITSQHRPISSGSGHVEHTIPVPPPVDSLRAKMHSRQASSSSNNSSSICNIGSPKPEKRQANSPLPPTPKSNNSQASHHFKTSSNSNLTSGRNSVISVIETGISTNTDGVEFDNTETSPKKHSKSLSPSKDIEGMYAKVMKKHKLSRNSTSSQNNSPTLARKQTDLFIGISPLDTAAELLMDSKNINTIGSDKSRVRSNSYSAKDHGYETIPADGVRTAVANTCTTFMGTENRKSDCYANMLQKERQQAAAVVTTQNRLNEKPPKHYETIPDPNITVKERKVNSVNDPGYEQLLLSTNVTNIDETAAAKKYVEYDPNYEELKSVAHSEDGYAKVLEKKHSSNDTDTIDGYSKLKGVDNNEGSGGYSTIPGADANHNYASIIETKVGPNIDAADETESDHYARIAEATTKPEELLLNSAASTPASIKCLQMASPSSITSSSLFQNTSSITTVTNSSNTLSTRQTPSSSQYESLTGSETDPNYESVYYHSVTGVENPYERLQTELTDTTQSSSSMTPDECSGSGADGTIVGDTNKLKVIGNSKELNASEVVVDDYFQV